MSRRFKWVLLLSALNLLLFLFRNHLRYEDHADKDELYNEDLSYWSHYLKPYSSTLVQIPEKFFAPVTKGSTHPDSIAQRLARSLVSMSRNKIGEPDPDFMKAEPLFKYNLLRQPSQKAECGNLSEIFAYSSNALGVPARYVELRGKDDFHVVNEYYSAGSWKLIDITYGLTGVQENLLQYRQKAHKGFLRNVDSLIPEAAENYYLRPSELYYYRYSNTDYAYKTSNKLKGYFLPISWYKIYSDKGEGSFLIPLVRLIAFLIWAFALTGLIIHYFRYRNDRSKKPEERI